MAQATEKEQLPRQACVDGRVSMSAKLNANAGSGRTPGGLGSVRMRQSHFVVPDYFAAHGTAQAGRKQ